MKLNTSDLVERIAAEHSVSKESTRNVIDSMLAVITGATRAGDEVNLAGFGRFKAADRAARSGRNPATGETIAIPASRKLTFSPAKAVRDALNVTVSDAKAAAG
jgi:DNA-binding protein HU-beta